MITEFIPNQFSNLDSNIETILPINILEDKYDIDIYMDDFSNYMLKNNLSDINYIEEGLNSLIKKKRKKSKNFKLTENNRQDVIKSVLSGILDNIKKEFKFNFVKFVGAYNFLKGVVGIPNPKFGYFLLLSSSDDNIYFIVFNKKNKKDRYYKYKICLKSGNFDKKSEIITPVDLDIIYYKINKNEKFYSFIYQEDKN